MTSKFSLQTLLDLSNLRLDEAAKKLGQLIAGEQEAGKRLQLLIDYREEYQGRFMAAAQSGVSPDVWQNYRAFLNRLDTAVEQAREAVQLSKKHTAAGQQEWLNKRGKVKAFDTLAQRHEARVQHKERRQEQKAVDEHAARRFKAQEEN